MSNFKLIECKNILKQELIFSSFESFPLRKNVICLFRCWKITSKCKSHSGKTPPMPKTHFYTLQWTNECNEQPSLPTRRTDSVEFIKKNIFPEISYSLSVSGWWWINKAAASPFKKQTINKEIQSNRILFSNKLYESGNMTKLTIWCVWENEQGQ